MLAIVVMKNEKKMWLIKKKKQQTGSIQIINRHKLSKVMEVDFKFGKKITCFRQNHECS